MARSVASLPAGSRITDDISPGVITRFFPVERVRGVLRQPDRASQREGDLPARVEGYCAIALALSMRSSHCEVLRCLPEGVPRLMDPSATVEVAGRPGIPQARSRLGPEPLKHLSASLEVPAAQRRNRATAEQGCLVPGVAPAQPGRKHLGCRRYG
jgi:hypothetical protein